MLEIPPLSDKRKAGREGDRNGHFVASVVVRLVFLLVDLGRDEDTQQGEH